VFGEGGERDLVNGPSKARGADVPPCPSPARADGSFGIAASFSGIVIAGLVPSPRLYSRRGRERYAVPGEVGASAVYSVVCSWRR
jgi:hypothetical protein